MRDVLAVLEDSEAHLWSVFECAVDLACDTNARLTLAKTTVAPRSYGWLGPYGVGLAAVPPANAEASARRVMARAAERVPACLPVSMVMLADDTQLALRRLIRTGRYDAIVAGPKLLRHHPRLRHELSRAEMQTVVVGGAARHAAARAVRV